MSNIRYKCDKVIKLDKGVKLDKEMINTICNIVNEYCDINKISAKITTKKSKSILVSFPHKTILEILNNKSFLTTIHFNFNNINLFNISCSLYPILMGNIDIIKKIMKEFKDEIYLILDCYNSVMTKNPKQNEIIINHFNMNYLYKLILKFEIHIKNMEILLIELKSINDDSSSSIIQKLKKIEEQKKLDNVDVIIKPVIKLVKFGKK